MPPQDFQSLSDQALYQTGYENYQQGEYSGCFAAWSVLSLRHPRKRKIKEQINIIRLTFADELLTEKKYNAAHSLLDECRQSGIKTDALGNICAELYFRLACLYLTQDPISLAQSLQCLEKASSCVKNDLRFDQFQEQLSVLTDSDSKPASASESLAEVLLKSLCSHPNNSRLAHIVAVFAYNALPESFDNPPAFTANLATQIIACFVKALNDESYWVNWVQDREKVYQKGISYKEIDEARKLIKAHIYSVLNAFAGEVGKSSEISHPLRHPEATWELEEMANTALGKLGGIAIAADPSVPKFSGGPLYIRLCNLENMLEEKLRHSANINQQPVSLFSPFGICEIFLKHDQPEKVVAFLKAWETQQPAETVSAYRQTIDYFELESVLSNFAKTLRQKSPQVAQINSIISNICQLTQSNVSRSNLEKQIVEKVLGRIRALKRTDPRHAIAILESVRQILPDPQIDGALSALLREYSVEAANLIMDSRDTNALEKYAADLRYALTLSPHIKQTRLDYCTIVRRCALWRLQSGEQQRPLILIQEAIRMANEGLVLHKNDPDLQRFLKKARQSYLVIRDVAGSPRKAPKNQLAAIHIQIKENSDPEIQRALAQADEAVKLFHKQQLSSAFQQLQKAYKLAPDSMLVRDILHNLMVSHKEQLLLRNRFRDALIIQNQIFQLFPGSHL